MRLLAGFLLTSALCITALVTPRAKTPAPYHRAEGDLVEDEYIVVLHKGHTIDDHFARIGIDLSKSADMFYPIGIIGGYRARLTHHIVHELIRYDPGVKFVEHDTYGDFITDHESGEAFEYTPPEPKSFFKRWTETVHTGYHWWSVMISAGRKLDVPLSAKGEFDDLYGHGTHVASIAGGYWSSAAHKASLINVKVMAPDFKNPNIGKRPANGGITQAVNDVTEEHMSNRDTKPKGWRGSVINMSLTGSDTKTFRDACLAAFEAGITIVVSAGNSNVSADVTPCKYTESTICVASSDDKYQKSEFSNYGPNVFVIAPGSNIHAASNAGDNKVVAMSGTSMAAPMVAGVMANFIGFEGITDDVRKVWKRVRSNQLNNIITGFPTGSGQSTVNALINNGISNPNRRSIDPYAGIPRDDLKLAALEADGVPPAVKLPIELDDTNITDATDTQANDHTTDAGGPTATLTETNTISEVTVSPTAAPTNGDYGFESDLIEVSDVANSTERIMPATSVTSVPALPTDCPSGCECVKASSGGCNCLCS